jgi:hypothetical protein
VSLIINKLLLSLTKTSAIFFSNDAHTTKQTALIPQLIFNDILIPIATSTKLLGVIIDKISLNLI